jgi:hypothetical protein
MANANKLSSYLCKLVSSLGSGLLRIARWIGGVPEGGRPRQRVSTTIMVCDRLAEADIRETASPVSAAKISRALTMPTGSHCPSNGEDESGAGIAIDLIMQQSTDRYLPAAQGRKGMVDAGSFLVNTAIWIARPSRQTAKRTTIQ